MPPDRALDIAANRKARKWSALELAGRGAWELLQFMFAWSPRQAWGWRNLLLRSFGAKLGRGVRIHPTVRIAVPWNLSVGPNTAIGDGAILYSLGTISIGADVTVSQHAHLCAGSHDYGARDLPLTKPPIVVEDGAWICADAFVGPGVTVGSHAIVAARAVAVRAVEAWTIVGGNPARMIRRRPPLEPA